ncbi:uncharacterized protein SPSC_05913 [Sporisorium scitamineum]|uniref:HIT-type domain-containing protein n=2 Tax=Sporisorium scitamineum TaxID=49012 RepID=A0A127ZIH2_9BASI|nr:uncharacterized protein SPSC_05913 [Sporisorium scitamineum]
MPSASTAICAQCEFQPSKYTCPACQARTCSLACTKAHKAADTGHCITTAAASRNVGSSNASSSTSSTPTNAPQGPAYVPLTDYTESHMMQDFLFLSSISRTTAETGRKILSMNLLPPSSTTPTNSAAAPPPPPTRQTHQQRQRDQLIKQLHYRRFKVMILPDGMTRRKLNQSHFQPKDKKFVLTVELTYSDRKAVLHRQDSTLTVEQVVLDDLQHRSFPNRKELCRVKAALESGATARGGRWVVSRMVIEQSRLPVPAVCGGEGENVLLTAWPKEWVVMVPAYSARLTNESTTRYLDWWERKRRWEEANPELAKQKEEEGGEAREGWGGKRVRGGWGGRKDEKDERVDEVEKGIQQGQAEGERERDTSVTEAAKTPEAAEALSTQGIISSSLLTMLSQRLGRNPQPPPSLEPSTQPAAPPSPSHPPQHPSTNTPTTTSNTDTATASATSINLTLTYPSRTTLNHLLQTIPEGYSLVEFPELCISASLASETGGKNVPLAGEGVDQADTEAQKADADELDEKAEKKEEELKVGSTVGRTGMASLSGLLAGYDSESSDDGEDDDPKEAKESVEKNQSHTQAEQVEDETQTSRSTLASLALQHGFFPLPNSTP